MFQTFAEYMALWNYVQETFTPKPSELGTFTSAHPSHVTCHLSHVRCHKSLFWNSVGGSFSPGLPHLVLKLSRPQCDQTSISVEVSLLLWVIKACGSPKLSFKYVDRTWPSRNNVGWGFLGILIFKYFRGTHIQHLLHVVFFFIIWLIMAFSFRNTPWKKF